MISTIATIEVKESNQVESSIFKYIGQILRAYVQKKISNDTYIIKFSKYSLLVQSKIKLKEGKHIFLRVESLRPKTILKQLTEKELESIYIKKTLIYLSEKIAEKPSFWKFTKTLYRSDPEIKALLLKIILNPKKITEKLFWESIKKLFFHLKHDSSSEYLTFIKSVNNHVEGLYLQIPCFYSMKDIEIYFEKQKEHSNQKWRYIIQINLNLSMLGPVNIIIEESEHIAITFRVKEKNILSIIEQHIDSLKDRLESDYYIKHIHIDCKIMPEEYWKKEFLFIISKKDNIMDIVA